MKVATIALLPGDGIGPEVTAAAGSVLKAVEDRFGHAFDLRTYSVGGAALDTGQPPLPTETLEGCLGKVLAIDDRDMGVVGKAHGWVSSFLIRWRFQRVRPE